MWPGRKIIQSVENDLTNDPDKTSPGRNSVPRTEDFKPCDSEKNISFTTITRLSKDSVPHLAKVTENLLMIQYFLQGSLAKNRLISQTD